MTPIQQMLFDTLTYIKEGIEENMDSHNRNASNRSVDSLKIRIFGNLEGVLESDQSSWLVMEKGRKGGKIPNGFQQIILQWMWDKGINVVNEERVARAIAWNIKKHGTKLHRSGLRDDIFTTRINDGVAELSRKVSWFAGIEIERIFQE